MSDIIIGFNAFLEVGEAGFNDRICHPSNEKTSQPSYSELEIVGGIIDQIYIDEDISIPYSIQKPNEWRYQTVLNAKFQGDLEGGSVRANHLQIEKIRFQRREWNELRWHDVAEIDYTPNERLLYEAIDKHVANDFVYQYSIIPITSTIIGNRVISQEVKVDFEGVFISDKDSNYGLLYDVELSDIQSNSPSTVFEPKGSKYPIVVHSNLDYSTFDVTSTFVSAETVNKDGKVDIRMERLGKDKLMNFMKNGKPKIYRDSHGNLKLVSVTGSPKEVPYNEVTGISKLSFSLVEIGDTDSETLKSSGLLEGLSGVF